MLALVMSIFDWLQIALGFIHVVRRMIARAALLIAGNAHAQSATTIKTVESAE
jgi:hypothetical protein